MIVQQINLYQDRFREKQLWISATQVAATLLIFIAAGAIWSLVLGIERGQAEQHGRTLKADQDRVALELATVSAELAELHEDKRLDRKIENTARQISARKSRIDALAAFADLQQRYPRVLNGKTPDIQTANLGSRGTWYRVRVGPPRSKSATTQLCSKLKSAGLGSCLVRAY